MTTACCLGAGHGQHAATGCIRKCRATLGTDFRSLAASFGCAAQDSGTVSVLLFFVRTSTKRAQRASHHMHVVKFRCIRRKPYRATLRSFAHTRAAVLVHMRMYRSEREHELPSLLSVRHSECTRTGTIDAAIRQFALLRLLENL